MNYVHPKPFTSTAYVEAQLLWLLDYAHEYDVPFNATLAEARKRHNRKLRERALAAPLPEAPATGLS